MAFTAPKKWDPDHLKGAPCLVERVAGNEVLKDIFPDNKTGDCSNCKSKCFVRPYNSHRPLICRQCATLKIKEMSKTKSKTEG